jgi:hypothetical protein
VHHHSASPRADRQAASPHEVNRGVIRSDLTKAAKLVLIRILYYAGHGDSFCWATNRTLARETGVTERHVRDIIPDLEARGLVRVERRSGSKHSKRDIYVGPCMHQVGTEFRLRLHEVGTEFRAGRNPVPAEVGTECRVKGPGKVEEKEDSPSPLDSEGIDPVWRRFRPPG